MFILGLDPSINHLGWAVMQLDAATDLNQPLQAQGKLITFGTIHSVPKERGLALPLRVAAELNAVGDLFRDPAFRLKLGASGEVDHVVIERPEEWGSYKSLASSQSDSLNILTITAGALLGYAIAWQKPVTFYTAKQWKGQLSKKATTYRTETKYQVTFDTADAADAAGLLDYFLETRDCRAAYIAYLEKCVRKEIPIE